MKVLFDYQIFSLQKYGGISRYFANLHYGINNSAGASSEIGVLFTNNAYIKSQNLFTTLLNQNIKNKSKRYKYNKWYCRYLVNQNKFDVLHPTFYNPYFLRYLKKPFVLTVHDMINERFPQFYTSDPAAEHKKELIKRADHIIAISEYTKKDMLEFYNINENKISVIHHGYQMRAKDDRVVTDSKQAILHERYLLYVGDRYAYKNFLFFVDSITPLIKHYAIKLVCAGGKIFNDEELNTFKKLKITDDVIRVDADDEQLTRLYKNALAFVYPSLYEGFGLPVLEAFNNNCPVILSDATSLPEVAGEAAEYFNPCNKESISSAVENMINNTKKQNELKAAGTERLKLFRFEDCLKKTLQIYSGL